MAQFAKTDIRYWRDKVFLPQYTRNGERHTSRHYSIRIRYKGERESFSLYTPNQVAAAAKARDIYLTLTTQGWAAARARFKAEGAPAKAADNLTVGEFLERIISTTTGNPRTLAEYTKALRKIVAESFDIRPLKIKGKDQRYAYRGRGGYQEWVKRIEAVKLAEVTPERVQKWKIATLKRAGSNPLKIRSAKISVNSTLLQAKALFAPARLAFAGNLGLPFSSPFAGIKLEARQSMRYQSSLDLEQLTQDALKELGPEELKIFLLAAFAGLRRNEIDKLQWAAFRPEQGTLRIEDTQAFAAKTEDSAGDIDLDPETIALFRGFQAKASGPFVIESGTAPRPGAPYAHYRCRPIFRSLCNWLQGKGIKARKPLHTLRKEFGSLICDAHGIYAASRALRHSDIRITSQHYLDKKNRVTVGLGHLLRPAQESSLLPFNERSAESSCPSGASASAG